MAVQHSDQVHNLYQAGAIARDWVTHEARRLQTMDDFLGPLTSADLAPAFDYIGEANTFQHGATVLGIGAGSGEMTERICTWLGGDYYALDVNEHMLSIRATDDKHKIHAKGTDIPVPAASFDITHSRAVIGWNAANASEMVAEQLRVTADRGAAIFSEFDWTSVGPGEGCDESDIPVLVQMRNIMLMGLCRSGFDPDYGSRLGDVVHDAVKSQPGWYKVVETRHELPDGDYREFILEAAENALHQLKAAGDGAALFAGILVRCIEHVRGAENLSIRLPQLITQTVYIDRNVQDA